MFGRAGESHLLRAMLGHVLQQEQGLVYMPPVLRLVLKTPGDNAHDLLVVLQLVGGLRDLCEGLASSSTYCEIPLRVFERPVHPGPWEVKPWWKF